MLKKMTEKLTNDYKEVPLFYVTFNLDKFIKEGEKGSCDLKIHPSLEHDIFFRIRLKELVDYIRKNYDMEKLTK